ncbi:hypothetical protein [Burkholderia pyrrocinia]|uniref:hypothetical protein n=1 Tax=Burkholderia pyrrocinia TaxID=60550 RepID=UPI001BCFE135|nr:hypothetical protein [Burkholderia pyrrocinia]QVN21641.1 hypothetical protein JYG32_19810 [Burkholderia pyrrocinia]
MWNARSTREIEREAWLLRERRQNLDQQPYAVGVAPMSIIDAAQHSPKHCNNF